MIISEVKKSFLIYIYIYIVCEFINLHFKYLYWNVSTELPYSVFMQKKQQMIQTISQSYLVGGNVLVHMLDDTDE